MRIAIVGNMNNNGFALLRYLRDAGLDADLILYKNDGYGVNAHFIPEWDSFCYENYSQFIRKSHLINSFVHALPPSLQIFFMLKSILRKILNSSTLVVNILTKREIKSTFLGYTAIIASGYLPAILTRTGFSVSLFFPYCYGIEGVNRSFGPQWCNIISRLGFEYGRYKQLLGIKLAANVILPFDELSSRLLNFKKINFEYGHIPIVYPDTCLKSLCDFEFKSLVQDLKSCQFSIFMSSRLLWSDEKFTQNEHSKNNHWVLTAFKDAIASRPQVKSRVLIVEYGPHVDKTKQLIQELELNKNVIWIPKTSRKNLLVLLRYVTISFGEFLEEKMIWGGTGWEALSVGTPLLQGYHFHENEFQSVYKIPPPPMLKIRVRKDVLNMISFAMDNSAELKKIGADAKKWFDHYIREVELNRWLEKLRKVNQSLIQNNQ